MNIEQIILVILSGLGVFHGFFIAAVLWNNKVGAVFANRLLSILMVVLSLRIGKSVIFEFYKPLPILYIYLGLCLLMFIGPLFLLYCRKLISQEQYILKAELLHFVPGVVFILLSILFEQIGFNNLSQAIAMLLFIIFYAHFFIYLLYVNFKYFKSGSLNTIPPEIRTWFKLLLYGFAILIL